VSHPGPNASELERAAWQLRVGLEALGQGVALGCCALAVGALVLAVVLAS
jgi:hypothetical protein